MERNLILKLNEVRKELEIPEKDFIMIVSLANNRRKKSNITISDELLYEIILEAMSNYDYTNKNKEAEKKASIEAIRVLINGERKERYLPDEILFNYIEDYLNIIENKERKEKNQEELVERSIKSIGL